MWGLRWTGFFPTPLRKLGFGSENAHSVALDVGRLFGTPLRAAVHGRGVSTFLQRAALDDLGGPPYAVAPKERFWRWTTWLRWTGIVPPPYANRMPDCEFLNPSTRQRLTGPCDPPTRCHPPTQL